MTADKRPPFWSEFRVRPSITDEVTQKAEQLATRRRRDEAVRTDAIAAGKVALERTNRIKAAQRELQPAIAQKVRGLVRETSQVLSRYNVGTSAVLTVHDGNEQVTKKRSGILGWFGATIEESVPRIRQVPAWIMEYAESTHGSTPTTRAYGYEKWTATTEGKGVALGSNGKMYRFTTSRSEERSQMQFCNDYQHPAPVEGGWEVCKGEALGDEELARLADISLDAPIEDQPLVLRMRARLTEFATGLIK